MVQNEAQMPTVRKLIQASMCLSVYDQKAIAHIRASRHYLPSNIAAIRFALAEQCFRDDTRVIRQSVLGKNVAEEVSGMVGKSKRDSKHKALKQTCFWFSKQDADRRRLIKKNWKFAKDAEAVRFAIRMQARLDGFAG